MSLPEDKYFNMILCDGLDTKKKPNVFYLTVELLNGLSPLERIHWCATQRQGNTMIHIFWDLNFLCDYLSLKGLFSNSVTYQILLNKILLLLTKRGSQLWTDNETSYCTVMLSVCAVYCICIASSVLLRPVRNTHWCFEMTFFGESLDLMYALHWFFEPQSSPATRQTKPSTAFFNFLPKHMASISVCHLSPAHFCLWTLKVLSKSSLIKSLLK